MNNSYHVYRTTDRIQIQAVFFIFPNLILVANDRLRR
uniref:Uncharacterized protein n=1 Tax=Arundo donax TaxID=35708 RepID=A0A0A9G2U5_ARUDO